MSKLSGTIAFLSGAVISGAAVWYVTKDYYTKISEEEIRSVKEAYAKLEEKKMKELGKQFSEGIKEGLEENSKTSVVNAKVADKGNITEYAKRVQNGTPMEYSKTIVPHSISISPIKAASSEERNELDDLSNASYVISPHEFGEMDGYTPVSLAYFADDILSDENGIIIDNVEEIVGDALNHFGEYEDDSVFVRNDAKRCDYEILRDERSYTEFRKTLPPNI